MIGTQVKYVIVGIAIYILHPENKIRNVNEYKWFSQKEKQNKKEDSHQNVANKENEF